MIDEKAVRPAEQIVAETLYQVTLEIEFQNRVQIDAGAVVSTAAVHQPDVLAIGVHVDAGHHAECSSFREFRPAVIRAIGIVVLGV